MSAGQLPVKTEALNVCIAVTYSRKIHLRPPLIIRKLCDARLYPDPNVNPNPYLTS